MIAHNYPPVSFPVDMRRMLLQMSLVLLLQYLVSSLSLLTRVQIMREGICSPIIVLRNEFNETKVKLGTLVCSMGVSVSHEVLHSAPPTDNLHELLASSMFEDKYWGDALYSFISFGVGTLHGTRIFVHGGICESHSVRCSMTQRFQLLALLVLGSIPL
jgi:hypothetical protein